MELVCVHSGRNEVTNGRKQGQRFGRCGIGNLGRSITSVVFLLSTCGKIHTLILGNNRILHGPEIVPPVPNFLDATSFEMSGNEVPVVVSCCIHKANHKIVFLWCPSPDRNRFGIIAWEK
jgi:hypothetical protein